MIIKGIDPGYINLGVVFVDLSLASGKMKVLWAKVLDLCKGQRVDTFMANNKYDYMNSWIKNYARLTNEELERTHEMAITESQPGEKLQFLSALICNFSHVQMQLVSPISLRSHLTGNAPSKIARKEKGKEYVKFLISRGIIDADDRPLLDAIVKIDHLTDAILMICYYACYRLHWKHLYTLPPDENKKRKRDQEEDSEEENESKEQKQQE